MILDSGIRTALLGPLRFSRGRQYDLWRVVFGRVGEHVVGIHDSVQVEPVGGEGGGVQAALGDELEERRRGGRVDQAGGYRYALDPKRFEVQRRRFAVDPDVRDRPAGAHQLAAQLEGFGEPSRLPHHARAEPVGDLLYLAHRLLGRAVDSHVSPQLPGALQTRGVEVYGDDPARRP